MIDKGGEWDIMDVCEIYNLSAKYAERNLRA